MYLQTPPSSAKNTKKLSPVINIEKKEQIKRSKIVILTIEEQLKQVLNTNYLGLNVNHLTIKDEKGRFVAIKYEELPQPYNQLLYINKSKFYRTTNSEDGGSSIFRFNEAEGLPDIIDSSIKFNLFKKENEIIVDNKYVWIESKKNYDGYYPKYPRHIRHTDIYGVVSFR